MTTLATNGVATNDNRADPAKAAGHQEWERNNRLDAFESMHDGLVFGLIEVSERIHFKIDQEAFDELRHLGSRLKVILSALESCHAQFDWEGAPSDPWQRRQDREEYTRAQSH